MIKDNYITIPQEINAKDVDCCYVCKGDCMTGAGIHDGDIVFVHSQNTANDGDIVVAYIKNTKMPLLKRIHFYPEEEKLVLSPENPKYSPLVFTGEERRNVRILGKAVFLQISL